MCYNNRDLKKQNGKGEDMVLIIAEKPSLARNIVAGIGKMDKKQGYFIDQNYIVTWVFGHLFSLVDIESYTGNGKSGDRRWTLDNLPCFPEKFRFELRKKDGTHTTDPGVKSQFNLIAQLCNRADVDTIVYIWRNTRFERIHGPQCSFQHCL